jgi:hypothetical protein
MFLIRIDFLRSRSEYNPEYSRSNDVSWVDGVYGPVDPRNKNSMTGYDLCSAIRKWLRTHAHTELSVCEVIMTDPLFEDMRQHVRKSNVFYSHIQSKQPIRMLNDMYQGAQAHKLYLPEFKSHLPQFNEEKETYWWIDYFSLRQCQQDFKPEQVVMLIKEIGKTVAEIDLELVYLRRSFCILEVYATLAGNARLLCTLDQHAKDLRRKLGEEQDEKRNDEQNEEYTFEADQQEGDVEDEKDAVDPASEEEDREEEEPQPVSTISASTRDPADKELIDRYIEDTIGFERMDVAVTAAAIVGAYSGLNETDGGLEDEKYLRWAAAQPPWLDLTGGGIRLDPQGEHPSRALEACPSHDSLQLVLTCMVVGCLNAIDETVCGSGYCAEHEHHPVGKASFEVVRQVLIDIRESTGYTGWTDDKEGWDKLETYTTMEELGYNHDTDEGVSGVKVKDGKLIKIVLEGCNLTGKLMLARTASPNDTMTDRVFDASYIYR